MSGGNRGASFYGEGSALFRCDPDGYCDAKDAREDMDACKEAGMNDYLAKPVEPQRLYQVLAEYLENPM